MAVLRAGDSHDVPAELIQGDPIRLIRTDPSYGVSYAAKNARLKQSDAW
jgi:hypothetical protein